MNTVTNINESPRKKISQIMAERFGVDPHQFVSTVKATCFNGQNVADEQFMQFLMIANEYNLNPFAKEIYAFPSRGGIQPIVSIDGWINIINSHAQFDGMEFNDKWSDDEAKLISVTCKIHRKDREHPTEVTEYMSECARSTDTWTKWPARMLRHKAAIQAARYAFGFSGIYEPDEIERMHETKDMGEAEVMQDEHAGLRGKYNAAMEQLSETVTIMQEGFLTESQEKVCEAWFELDQTEKELFWCAFRAPTKLTKAGLEPPFTPQDIKFLKEDSSKYNPNNIER